MSQVSGEEPTQPAMAHAEELVDSMGQRIGFFTSLFGQRIQNVTASIREGTDQMNQPHRAVEEKASQPTIAYAEEKDKLATERFEEKGKLAMERSEELVDRMTQRLSHYASLASFQIQKAAARTREETEDMWAEAQNIRKPQ